MPWIKKGLIFKPEGRVDWSQTHAQVPSCLVLKDRLRIYYATRDQHNRSLTSFIDVSKNDPNQILYIHDQPIMNLGTLGTHDEDGVMTGSVINHDDTMYLYYTGWSKGLTVPYRVSIGLAISRDGGVTFERVFNGPIVDRTINEPYMTMSPYVTRDQNGLWQMWYGSGTGWVTIDGKPEPLYITKYAQSTDGLVWQQHNISCINPLHPLESNTRPSVLKTAQGYEMWFSYRHSIDFRNGSGSYRIGYATSVDGKNWIRQTDQDGLEVTNQNWDGRMIAYPNVVNVNNQKIMFYNGDGFGSTGFGYAIWSPD